MNKLIQSLCLLLSSSCFADLMQNPPASLEPGEYIWSFSSNQSNYPSGNIEASLRFNVFSEIVPSQASPGYFTNRTELLSFDLFANYSELDDYGIPPVELKLEDIENSYELEVLSDEDGWGLLFQTSLYDLQMFFIVVDNEIAFNQITFTGPSSHQFMAFGSQLVQVPAPGILSLSLTLLMQKRRKRNGR